VLHVHIRRFPIAQLPDEATLLRDWLNQRFVEKDRLMDAFYMNQTWHGGVEIASISLKRTLPPTLLFSAALLAGVLDRRVRYVYMATIAVSPLLYLWLRLRKCL